MSDWQKTVNKQEWDLFVWFVDSCEKKQNNACKGCAMIKDCISLYQHVSNICISNKVESEFEHDNQRPSKGNPCCENTGRGLGRIIRRANRDNRLSEGIGI